MKHKINPLYWLIRAMDGVDAYIARYDYRGGHCSTGNT